LGQKTDNKHHPLLVGFSSENDKQSLLAVAPRLRSSNEFKKVYIVSDMTKRGRDIRKLLQNLREDDQVVSPTLSAIVL